MDKKHVALLRDGFRRYLECRGSVVPEPLQRPLPYDFDQIGAHQWRVMGGAMVEDELRDVTNMLNGWQGALRRWHAWNAALAGFDEQQAWALRIEFVEALARECLLLASAARDAIVFTATNAMHQVRLAMGGGYRDRLEGDPQAPNKRPKRLSRSQREERLEGVMAPWGVATSNFLAKLRKIDDQPYRSRTFDYRNRFSHEIAPSFAIGFTRFVTRTVAQAEELVQQPDGTALLVKVPDKMVVSYAFGGTPPLNMDEAWTASFDQYCRARECFESYRGLLARAMDALPPAPQRT